MVFVSPCVRVGKFLLMLQSIKRAKAAEPENGELHSVIVDFILSCKWL